MSTARDKQVVVYVLDENFKNAKLIVKREKEILGGFSCSAIAVANIPHRRPVLVVAISNGEIVEIY